MEANLYGFNDRLEGITVQDAHALLKNLLAPLTALLQDFDALNDADGDHGALV